MCRKIAFFGLRAEILLARSQGLLDSRAGPFLGSVKKYWFFGEIFTSAYVYCISQYSCTLGFRLTPKQKGGLTLNAIYSKEQNIPDHSRGKVMSHKANKLQMPFLANSIYSSDRFLERSINSCDNQINSCRH